MNVYITFDYELFFGINTGTVENSILKPTRELIKIAEKYNIKFVFFVDSGFLIKLDEYRKKFPVLENDYQKIIAQIQYLNDTGHDIQLHIHPHWEDSYFDGNKWIIDTSRYRLQQFDENEIDDIVYRYKKVLTKIVGNKVFAYRAGGWCIQPFEKINKALKKHNIWLDSTVFLGGRNLSHTHYFDFTKAPKKSSWKFDNNPMIEDKDGFFTEIPISSQKVNPLFYWKFAFTKKITTNIHKIFGDGLPVGASKKDILKMLFMPSWLAISCDGYKSILLDNAYNKAKNNNNNNFVVIGHPKAQTLFSLNNLEKFIIKNKLSIVVFNDRE
jgi:hypothetical protein